MSNGSQFNMTADGDTPWINVTGPIRLSLTGGFGGGTAKLQVKLPDDSAVDVASGSFTAATDTIFDFPVNARNTVRVNVASSTTPTLAVLIQP